LGQSGISATLGEEVATGFLVDFLSLFFLLREISREESRLLWSLIKLSENYLYIRMGFYPLKLGLQVQNLFENLFSF